MQKTVMENNVVWHPRATRQFLKIDRRYRAAIEAKVAMLKDFPFLDGFYLDVKHLSGNQYRIRHGDYRIFFEIIDSEPKIINIMQVKRRTTTTYKH